MVKRIDHNSQKEFDRESWDLKTDSGLDVSFGMYFFVVDASGLGTTRGKFAIIK